MTALARHTGAVFRALVVSSLPCIYAQPFAVRLDSDKLRVSAPGLRFFSGRALERLQNGATVVFPMQLTLLTDGKNVVRHRIAARFAASFDLWEEKFSVTRLGNPKRSASHLNASGAESWCLENLPMPTTGLSDATPFWLRLEVRADETGLDTPEEDTTSFSLTRLVDLFSRPPPRDQPDRREEIGPLRLADLKKP